MTVGRLGWLSRKSEDARFAGSDVCFDVAALCSAIEARDAEAQIPMYSLDADVMVVDPDHPPRSPMRLHGRDAIASWISEICYLNMTHHVVDVVRGGDRIAFTEEGLYRDGTKVLSASTATVRDGLIRSQRVVLVWDDWE